MPGVNGVEHDVAAHGAHDRDRQQRPPYPAGWRLGSRQEDSVFSIEPPEAVAYGTRPPLVGRLDAGGYVLDLRDAVIFVLDGAPRADRLRRIALAGRLWWRGMRVLAGNARGASGACWAFARGRLNEPPNPLADR